MGGQGGVLGRKGVAYMMIFKENTTVWFVDWRKKGCCSTAVNSTADGRRTMRMTTAVHAVDGRRTMNVVIISACQMV